MNLSLRFENGRRRLVSKTEVDVMVFRLSANTKSTSFEARKQYAYELTKGRWVQYSDSLGSTPCDIICIDSTSRYRAFAFVANLINPICSSVSTRFLGTREHVPEHGKHLSLPFRLRSSFIAV